MTVIETIPFIGTINSTIQHLFKEIQRLIQERTQKCYFGHLCAHSGLPRPLCQGNNQVDQAT